MSATIKIKPSPNDKVGDYVIVSYIGHGGYGDVYYATDTLGKKFVLKILREECSEESEREIRGISLLRRQIHSSDRLPIIYHVGHYENHLYYTMDPADNRSTSPNDYIPDTLDALIREKKQFSAAETLEICSSVISSLEILHQHGLVHRDIKPSNIIRFHGKWMLTDFGLLSSSPKSFVGSPGFLAPFPENGITLQSEMEADFFSLGKILYCLFSGLSVDNYPLLPEKTIIHDMIVIRDLYYQACAYDSHKRFHSCTEFRDALAKAQHKLEYGFSIYKKIRNMWIAILGIVLLVSFSCLLIARKNIPQPAANTPLQDTLIEHKIPNSQEAMVKIIERENEYHILCCFPVNSVEDSDPHYRPNQFKAMGIVKNSLAQYLRILPEQHIKIRHAVYLKQPFSVRSLLVYMYVIVKDDVSLELNK